MRRRFFYLFCSTFLLTGWLTPEANAQASKAEQHVAAAKTIASEAGLNDFNPTFKLLSVERKSIDQRAAASSPAKPADSEGTGTQ